MLTCAVQTGIAMAAVGSPPQPTVDVGDCPPLIDANGILVGDVDGQAYSPTWVQPSVPGEDPDISYYSQVVINTRTASLTLSVGGAEEDNAMMFDVHWLYRKERVKGGAARSMHHREVLYSTHINDVARYSL
eukprot:4986246-Pleurochrysis_carterae.AAC.2